MVVAQLSIDCFCTKRIVENSSVVVKRRMSDALDNLCNSAGAMAARCGEQLHGGRVYSHITRTSASSTVD